jgi:mannose-6-phosphate isomerase-like protein (cupin superfamily)
MIRAGDSLVNPVTGETLVFHQTAADTNGELTRFETILEPAAFVASAHVHPHQSERFTVIAGTLSVKQGRETVELRAGESIVIEPGTPHRFRNASDEVVRFLCEVRPALQFESLIETMFSLAADGKTNRKGMPNPLRLAVIANHHFDDVRLPVVPHALQKAALAMGAPVGRVLGFRATYEPVAGTPALA